MSGKKKLPGRFNLDSLTGQPVSEIHIPQFKTTETEEEQADIPPDNKDILEIDGTIDFTTHDVDAKLNLPQGLNLQTYDDYNNQKNFLA
jgi:hypothetical protein